ncbi:MAG: c-type cytochrome [Burkholderiaceae bacterium]|jgi:mono/diheme cytochrome c family protein
MRLLRLVFAIATASALACEAGAAPASTRAVASDIESGKHLVLISHCNNCHTAGYAANAGKVPQERWLAGNPVGWRGKGGTVYASNLRLFMQDLSEDAWMQVARVGQWRAPMPWWSLRDYSDDELRAIYRYVRSLKPLGTPAPASLPAGQMPPRPYNQLPDVD